MEPGESASDAYSAVQCRIRARQPILEGDSAVRRASERAVSRIGEKQQRDGESDLSSAFRSSVFYRVSPHRLLEADECASFGRQYRHGARVTVLMRLASLLRLKTATLVCLCGLTLPLQCAEVTASVRVSGINGGDPTGAVVSLTPVYPAQRDALKEAPVHATLVQKNKTFLPHVLVIPPGSTVDFPNHDPFFHNVFSLFEGKRFDLGLYESGTSRSVKFDRTGVSYIFCNIHPQMNA